jgi:hypothetical protein
VVVSGFNLWGSYVSWSWGGVLAPTLVLAGIAGLAVTWWVGTPRSLPFQLSGLLVALIGTVGTQGAATHLRQFYSTDSAAFDQEAARLLLRGVDPYSTTLGGADRFLQQPSAYWTYTIDGGHIVHVSYPAGSFLLEVPLMAAGLHHLVVDWLDLAAWVVTGVLLFAMVPAALRWWSVLLFSVPVFAAIFGSGGTDAVFIPFLVMAVWRWDRFALGKATGVVRWIGPLAMGIACSMKQTPWFLVPFVVIGLVLEARSHDRPPLRPAATYLAMVVGVFTAVNLPFVLWSPGAWAQGTLLPLTHPLVADGQGLVTLVLHGPVRGVSLPLLTVSGVLVLLVLLAAMVVWYPPMKRIWLLLLPLTFFVVTRSLSSYLLDLIPAAIVAAVTVAPAVVSRPSEVEREAGPGHRRAQAAGRRPGRPGVVGALATGALGLGAVVAAALAFASHPLDLSVRSVTTSAHAVRIEAVTVTVVNSTDRPLTPHFMVTIASGHPDGFWQTVDRRPVVVGAHGATTVTIVPDQPTAAPVHGTHWLVEAYTSSPSSLNTTGLLFWTLGQPLVQSPMHRSRP